MNFKKTKLDYSGKELTEFPAEIFTTPRVYKLNLSHNKIKEIPKEISKLKYLETLDLSGNQIRHLKAKLFELANLKILIINDNQIISLPIQIQKLQQLKILNLANNKLSDLPIEVTHLKNLEELNLTDNHLDCLPSIPAQRFPKLKALWIAHNPLRHFTANKLLDGMINLKSFYCYSPKLENPVVSSDSIILKAARSKGNFLPILKEMIKGNVVDNKAVIESNDVKPQNSMKPGKIFISYSHKDSKYLDRLKVHLKVLGREVLLDAWADTRIRSSDRWKEKIEKALNEASDAILLISTDFLASDFIYANELPPLLEAARLKDTRIFPVIVHPCQFLKNKSLSQFQAVNSPDEPLSECTQPMQERIWIKLCDDIQYFLEH